MACAHMYMFRSKRATLTRRLLRASAAARPPHGGGGDQQQVNALLRQLKEPQLQLLAEAVELAGSGASECVLWPRRDARESAAVADEPHVVACRAWRWPDLAEGSELRRLPACHAKHDPVYVCCNPYHLSRLASLPPGAYTISYISETYLQVHS